MFRDVIAMLAMLAAVTAICLIVIGLIYWFAPPGWYRAPPLRTTQQPRLTVASLSFLGTAKHGAGFVAKMNRRKGFPTPNWNTRDGGGFLSEVRGEASMRRHAFWAARPEIGQGSTLKVGAAFAMLGRGPPGSV
jgi:hypothetical protein